MPLNVGDKMRISVELIRLIDRLPDHLSVLVKVADIVDVGDGLKVLRLENAEEFERIAGES